MIVSLMLNHTIHALQQNAALHHAVRVKRITQSHARAADGSEHHTITQSQNHEISVSPNHTITQSHNHTILHKCITASHCCHHTITRKQKRIIIHHTITRSCKVAQPIARGGKDGVGPDFSDHWSDLPLGLSRTLVSQELRASRTSRT